MAFVLAVAVSPARGQPSPSTCEEISAAHAMDFWLGDWEVLDADGNLLGRNSIHSVLSGCAITEAWRGAGGGHGQSLFYFHSWLGQWRQVWITSVPQRPGSVKEKRHVESFTDGGLRFQGEVMVSPEHYVMDRTTLRPLPDGRVHQLIEWSNDDGRTWNTGFEGWYVRVER